MKSHRSWHRKKTPAAAFAAVLIAAAPLAAQEQEVDAFMSAQLEARGIPGASVAVVRDSEVVLARGYGMANVEQGTPATENTVYQLASVTKQFTATAIMMLVEDGRLSLDSRLTDILDGVPQGWSDVTVRHLLNHTSGIKSYTSVPGFADDRDRHFAHEEVIALVADSPREFAAGQGWNYNNTGYFLLGMIIQNVSGIDYDSFLQKRIFGPLGMTSTRLNDSAAIIPGLAQGYDRRDGSIHAAPSVSPTQPFSAGALVSTVLDLARWDAALYTERLLPSEVLERMWRPTTLNGGQTHDYGFGWEVSEYRTRRRAAHGGGIPGFNTYVARYPDDRTTVIVLTNLQGGGAELLANAVATFYIPALREHAPKPVADADPATTQRLRAITTTLATGTGDREWFTEESRGFFFPDRIKEGAQLGALGELGSFELMEETMQGEANVRGYRAVFGSTPMRVTYVLAPDGRIAGIQLRPEEPV
jgi:D-alanyl-D-alanine carboxypeptidase